MESIDFPGSNATFNAKILRSNEKPLRAHLSGLIRVTAWEITDEDLKLIIETRKVYLLEVVKNENYPSIKIVSDNPVPLIHQNQFPILNLNETNTKKDA